MILVLICAFAALLAAYLLQARRVARLEQALLTLQQDQGSLAQAWQATGAEARRLLPVGTALLSIEILNPLELASRESRMAGVLGQVTPTLLRKLVYERVREQLLQDLPQHGVEAEIRLHGVT